MEAESVWRQRSLSEEVVCLSLCLFRHRSGQITTNHDLTHVSQCVTMCHPVSQCLTGQYRKAEVIGFYQMVVKYKLNLYTELILDVSKTTLAMKYELMKLPRR